MDIKLFACGDLKVWRFKGFLHNKHLVTARSMWLLSSLPEELNIHIERAIDTSSFDDVIVTSQFYLCAIVGIWRL